MKRFVVVTYMSTVIGCIISIALLSVLMLFAPVDPASARGRDAAVPYIPEIIPVPQEHAWCYVLVNEQSKVVGDIHILSCVPKLGE